MSRVRCSDAYVEATPKTRLAEAPPGPPAMNVNASFGAGWRVAGMTTSLSRMWRPDGRARFSGTSSVPQRAWMRCGVHGRRTNPGAGALNESADATTESTEITRPVSF